MLRDVVVFGFALTVLHYAEAAGHVDATSLGLAFSQVLEAGLDVYTPVSPVLGNTRCRKHGLLLRQGVKEGKLWALHMLDASSKLPSGLLTGNLVQPGNFDQCLAVSHVDPKHGPITGQHCHVYLGVKNAMSALNLVEKCDYGVYNGTGLEEVESLLAQARFGDALALVGATWSLCVPASCSPDELQRHLRATLPDRVQVRVDPLACANAQSFESRSYNNGALLVLYLFGCIGFLVAAGTVYDLITDETTSRNQYLIALSLYENGRSLMKISTSPDNFPSFDGLRCISVLWTIVLHHFLFHLQAPTVNYRNLNEIATDWMHLIFTNGTLSVDSMFVITGALVAVNFLREREQNKKFSLWHYYLNRYVSHVFSNLRLTPASLVMLLNYLTLVSYTSDAPLFKPTGVFVENSCKKYGWMGLLYISNYFDPDYLCNSQLWSSCVDMQLFWLSPLFLFPLWRSPRQGGMLLLALGVTSIGAVFSITYQNQMQPVNSAYINGTNKLVNSLYFNTHLRATPWLIGVGLGYLLHKTEEKKDVLSGIQAVLGWTVSLLLTSYAFLSAHAYFQPGAQFDSVNTALYMALMRPTWALGVAWVLFACERSRGGAMNTFLSWPGWQVPSRLCYGVFFTNLQISGTLAMFKKTPQYYTDLQTVVEYFGLVVLSFISGAVLHLFVEAPCCRLYQLYMREESKPQKEE